MHVIGIIVGLAYFLKVVKFFGKNLKEDRAWQPLVLVPVFIVVFSWFAVAKLEEIIRDIKEIRELKKLIKDVKK